MASGQDKDPWFSRRRSEFNEDDNNKPGTSTGRQYSHKHPPHLKGKEIGLFYARRSAQKRRRIEDEQMPVVRMNDRKWSSIVLQLQSKSLTVGKKSNISYFTRKYEAYLSDSDKVNQGRPLHYSDVHKIIPHSSAKCLELLNEFKERKCKPFYKQMQRVREKLPVFKMKDEILELIRENEVIVLTGETGCGKTTQVPQFILDSYIESEQGSLCNIVCTQPRRISAITVAERVAEERAILCDDGKELGYQIRLESKLPQTAGSILYCTTGVVFQWLHGDPLLSRVSHIIVDEVHERDILSDFLLIVLKDIMKHRNNLKVILMSATLDSQLFSNYFDKCPQLNVKGFTYPVEVFTLEDAIEVTRYNPEEKPRSLHQRYQHLTKTRIDIGERHSMVKFYEDNKSIKQRYSEKTMDVLYHWDENNIDLILIAELLKYIDSQGKDGAVLVFLPGWENISKLNSILSESGHFMPCNSLIIPLHSLLPTVNQKGVFKRPPKGIRKIVLATNIAETSITIDDIAYVIDCGKIKMKNFDYKHNIATLKPEWVAKSNIKQRRGRAGRTQPGACYHLTSMYKMKTLEEYQLPEMLRVRLEELILQIKILNFGKAKEFLTRAIQPPDSTVIDLSLDLLKTVGALTENEILTPIGYHLARLPMDPLLGKMIILGAIFCCLDPVLSIAASLSYKDAFVIALGEERKVDKKRKELSGKSQSDHLMIAYALQGWEMECEQGNGSCFASKYFLSSSVLKMLNKMKTQLAQYLVDLRFLEESDPKNHQYNVNSGNESLIKAIVCAGLYPNVAKITVSPKKVMVIRLDTQAKAHLHPKSVNVEENNPLGSWMVYHLKVKSSKIFIHDSTIIHAYPLIFFGGKLKSYQEKGQHFIAIDEWIVFKCSSEAAWLIQTLRKELDDVLQYRICNPGLTDWNAEKKEGSVLQCVVDLITSEEYFAFK